MIKAFKKNWPVYFIEAWGLATFMISAVLFTIIVEHPDLPVRQSFDGSPMLRRLFIGVAMGLTAIGIIYSPWGKKSGAHLNPAVTLSFLRLKKISNQDAFFYIMFQFIGGYLGVLLFKILLYSYTSSTWVNYAVTIPGPLGWFGAMLLEALLAFTLFMTILFASNNQKFASLTGVFAGIWLAIFITFEAPFSGMSINPARTFASALPANIWTHVWIYFASPVAGMLLAAEVYKNFCHKSSAVLKCHMSGNKHNCNTYKD